MKQNQRYQESLSQIVNIFLNRLIAHTQIFGQIIIIHLLACIINEMMSQLAQSIYIANSETFLDVL